MLGLADNSRALITVDGVAVLMAHDQHPDPGVDVTIDHRVRKTSERQCATILARQFTDIRKLLEEIHDALELL